MSSNLKTKRAINKIFNIKNIFFQKTLAKLKDSLYNKDTCVKNHARNNNIPR